MVYNIQGLRAIAALMVVLYHGVHDQNNAYRSDLHADALASGVDIFFVVSGFVMVYVTHESRATPFAFLKDRILRIYPVYWLVTLMLVMLTCFGLKPVGVHAWDAGDLFSSLVLFPNVRADGRASPIVSVAWTLIFEVYFYVVFAASLLIRASAIRVITITSAFTGVVLLGILVADKPLWLKTYSDPVILEFCVGCVLGLAYQRELPRARRHILMLAVGLLALGVAGIVVSDSVHSANPSWNRALYFGLPATCIVTAALLAERQGINFKHPFLLLLGAASYSIYLVHQLLLHVAFKFSTRASALSEAAGIVSAWAIAALFVLAVGIGMHLYFERPVTRLLKAALQDSPRARRPTAGATS